MEKGEGGYKQNWEKKGNNTGWKTLESRRERKNKCVRNVEHKEVFVSFVMCRKRKMKLNDRQQQTKSFQFINDN